MLFWSNFKIVLKHIMRYEGHLKSPCEIREMTLQVYIYVHLVRFFESLAHISPFRCVLQSLKLRKFRDFQKIKLL